MISLGLIVGFGIGWLSCFVGHAIGDALAKRQLLSCEARIRRLGNLRELPP